MAGEGASASVKAQLQSTEFGGASALTGVSAGLAGATDSASLTGGDCMFKLQGRIAADLDVGAFVGGSVSVNPCAILKAAEAGYISNAHVIAAFGAKAARDVAHAANDAVHTTEKAARDVAHVANDAVHTTEKAAEKVAQGAAHVANDAVHTTEKVAQDVAHTTAKAVHDVGHWFGHIFHIGR